MSNIDDTNEDTLEMTGSVEYFDNPYQDYDDEDDSELAESYGLNEKRKNF